jgi:hypothetical protein
MAKTVYQVMIRSLIFLYNNAPSHDTTTEGLHPTIIDQMLSFVQSNILLMFSGTFSHQP